MSTPANNLETVRRYLGAIEGGRFDSIADIFDPDITIEQLPNRIYPKGLQIGLRQMAEAAAKGRELLSAQSYEIRHALVGGDSVAVEVVWTGTLSAPFGSLDAGSQMRAYSAMFFEFKNGKIASQRNYDCFEPW
ncbi:MAG TPA: nuclear transport factor 2 family protein [Candidatus Sulfotelmatobacter sp.]|nr:nuclear transport factor 2 family protein [Candidatus Sulfotelmatobacter sp.]